MRRRCHHAPMRVQVLAGQFKGRQRAYAVLYHHRTQVEDVLVARRLCTLCLQPDVVHLSRRIIPHRTLPANLQPQTAGAVRCRIVQPHPKQTLSVQILNADFRPADPTIAGCKWRPVVCYLKHPVSGVGVKCRRLRPVSGKLLRPNTRLRRLPLPDMPDGANRRLLVRIELRVGIVVHAFVAHKIPYQG